jgi:hypothetical protein
VLRCRAARILLFAVLPWGCGGASERPPADGGGTWLVASAGSLAVPLRESQAILIEPAVGSAVGAPDHTTAEGRSGPPRRGARRVDVSLRGANLPDALRLLAEAGRFDLVVDGDLGGTVTIDLYRVEPYEALVLMAEAKGAEVARHGNLVIVRPRRPTAASVPGPASPP